MHRVARAEGETPDGLCPCRAPRTDRPRGAGQNNRGFQNRNGPGGQQGNSRNRNNNRNGWNRNNDQQQASHGLVLLGRVELREAGAGVTYLAPG